MSEPTGAGHGGARPGAGSSRGMRKTTATLRRRIEALEKELSDERRARADETKVHEAALAEHLSPERVYDASAWYIDPNGASWFHFGRLSEEVVRPIDPATGDPNLAAVPIIVTRGPGQSALPVEYIEAVLRSVVGLPVPKLSDVPGEKWADKMARHRDRSAEDRRRREQFDAARARVAEIGLDAALAELQEVEAIA
jgi:hypothetical protein